MMKIVNLTPHVVVLIVGDRRIEIPPSGTVCRAREEVTPIGTMPIGDGVEVPVLRIDYGEPEGLPAPELGTRYIVSAIAAQAIRRHHPDRRDILTVTDFVRDESGRIVGARALALV
ncbi:MAG: hypothetical protein C4291_14815 [Candidatus Dadabacteria bacterium]